MILCGGQLNSQIELGVEKQVGVMDGWLVCTLVGLVRVCTSEGIMNEIYKISTIMMHEIDEIIKDQPHDQPCLSGILGLYIHAMVCHET